MNPLHFYTSIPPFSDFSGLTDDKHFSRVPDGWWIVLTDVKGSTKAINEGRYTQVNMVGASSITCVLNAIESYEFPFVFGGDGSTLLIPQVYLAAVSRELQYLQALSLRDFDLELRVGMVAVTELYKEGYTLEVGKYELSPGNCLAQFRGTAITRAENMVKSEESGAVILRPGPYLTRPKLEGLSCRINPLATKNGVIVTVLARPVIEELTKGREILHQLLEKLRAVLNNDFKSASPVDQGRLSWNLVSPHLAEEARMSGKGRFGVLRWLSKLFHNLWSNFSLTYNLSLGSFDPRRYKTELVINSDFKKFDGTLRMVIDCSLSQARAVEEVLVALHLSGRIFYGIHKSAEALMTCLVHSATANRHVHFIDGADGGYALAALQMKKQLKEIAFTEKGEGPRS
jgi:hypothetical protein